MPALLRHSPNDIEHARILYEQTDLSPKDIARTLQISPNTFYRRVEKWGWRRRRLRVSEVDAMAQAAAESRDDKLRELGARVEHDRRSAVERAEAAVVGQISALEAMRQRVALAAMTMIDGERASRTLGHLARALAQIEAVKRAATRAEDEREARRAMAERADGWGPREPEPDPDELRNQLAERLERLVAQHRMDAEQRRIDAEEEDGLV